MSAILGLVYFDGRADREGVVKQMMASIAHRGPDGASVAASGGASFGKLALHTTPHAHADPGVIRDSRGLFVSDARLDHRDELRASLQPGAGESAVSDAALVYQQWLRSQTSCVQSLAGDFVFAAWDAAGRALFCARDHIGVRPFYYFHSPGNFFIFASQIRALFAHPEVPRRLNPSRLAHAWAALHTDQRSTFYEGISRLPAAHTLLVTPKGLQLQRYWALDAGREASFASDADAEEEFRRHFQNAVRSRLATCGKVAVELSGGLDSSAVACVARDQAAEPLRTYSAVFPTAPASDERPFIDAVIAQGGFDPAFVRGDEEGPLSPFGTFLDYEDEGSYGTNFFLRHAMHRAMQRDGVRVFLDGFDGDTTVGHGNLRLAELAAGEQWAAFDQELEAVARRHHWDARAVARMYAGPALKNEFQTGGLKAFLAFTRRAAPHFRESPLRLGAGALLNGPRIANAMRFLRGGPRSARQILASLVDPGFARAICLKEAIEAAETGLPADLTERARLIRLLNSGSFAFGLERYDYHAAATGMECRHPFTDLRLIEFSASLPSHLRLRDGFNRWIMRSALAKTLPPAVAWRPGKANLTSNFMAGLFQRNAGILERWLFAEHASLAAVVNVPVARELYLNLKADPRRVDEQTVFALFRVLTSARWLAHAQQVRRPFSMPS